MLVLGIEGTAHTVSAGIVSEERILSNVNSTYLPPAGGIHPREAAIHHSTEIVTVIRKSLAEANAEMKDIDAVAFSSGPGLGPCLRVAATAARTLSIKFGKPIVRVNHPLGHIEIGRKLTGAVDPAMLYVSGGNTQVLAHINGRYRVIGETIDIGVGNMLDKLARDFGISFPGGPQIERMAAIGSELHELPYSVKGMNCSFSGILTAALALKKAGKKPEDIFFSVQETAFAMLVEILERALYLTGKKEIMIAGGVARNDRLRQMITEMAAESGYDARLTDKQYCMDNGAMIAQAGMLIYKARGGERIEETQINQRERIDSVDAPWIKSGKLYPAMGAGAESVTSKDTFYGRDVVFKQRLSKKYRNPLLDSRIKTMRQRTEFILLKKMNELGIGVPVVYDYNPYNNSLTLGSIKGVMLSQFLADAKEYQAVISKLGKTIGTIHTRRITHGDLTTNNIIVADNKVYLIDPSMGRMDSTVEDMASDIFLLSESFRSLNSNVTDLVDIFIDSYNRSFRDSSLVMETLNLMEKRRRYV
ncbi:MAG: Kae1-associated kinase Bud32 [Thermoplasmatales archaeon B_DKE]|nr:MAG: Kae1-associated kinase Bud32 [Thermoplasmatales archaeon B_DKE]